MARLCRESMALESLQLMKVSAMILPGTVFNLLLIQEQDSVPQPTHAAWAKANVLRTRNAKQASYAPRPVPATFQASKLVLSRFASAITQAGPRTQVGTVPDLVDIPRVEIPHNSRKCAKYI